MHTLRPDCICWISKGGANKMIRFKLCRYKLFSFSSESREEKDATKAARTIGNNAIKVDQPDG